MMAFGERYTGQPSAHMSIMEFSIAADTDGTTPPSGTETKRRSSQSSMLSNGDIVIPGPGIWSLQFYALIQGSVTDLSWSHTSPTILHDLFVSDYRVVAQPVYSLFRISPTLLASSHPLKSTLVISNRSTPITFSWARAPETYGNVRVLAGRIGQ